ncbi:MAG TPA: zf-HC2 domain-containing protein [Jatrophihabitantaceae bacterium]|nr:zf-HC2 domain-containing protein [Jatrophihabitantaceae bacterium]
MGCRQFVKLITDYLEGVLDQPTVAAIERHFCICPPWVLYLRQMTETVAELGRAPIETLSDRTKRDLVAAFRDLRVPPG